MSKAKKIAVTLGVCLFLALVLSIREHIDNEAVIVILSIINLAGIFYVLRIWSRGGNDTASMASQQENDSPVSPREWHSENRSAKIDTPVEKTERPIKEVATPPSPSPSVKLSVSFGAPYEQQLLEALRNACFPKNFMDPYDHEKVSIANELYKKLQEENLTPPDIYALRDRAVNELGITIDSSFLFDALAAACNPIQYMDPYDAQKVAATNDIYRQILDNKSDINALESLRKVAEERGLLETPAEKKAATSIADDTGAPQRPGGMATPCLVVNHWRSSERVLYRIAQYDKTSDLLYLERQDGDSWVKEVTLKRIAGRLNNGGLGSEYVDIVHPWKQYKMALLSGSLIERTHEIISRKWEWVGI